MPNIIENEELYESIVLAGVRSPGSVKLAGHERKVGWDVKTAPGQKGASMTRKSEEPVEFTATFYLVKDDGQGIDDFADWPAFADLINSTVSGADPKALDIYHPDLAEQGITSVVKSKIGGRQYDGKGGCTIVVTFTEYFPPKPAGGSPSGSKSKKPDPKKPDPDQAALDEIAKLTAKYQATPWG